MEYAEDEPPVEEENPDEEPPIDEGEPAEDEDESIANPYG